MDYSSSLPRQKVWGDLYVAHQQGFWLPSYTVRGTNETIEQFKPLPTDIILASFPKTGTTWLKSLLYSIVNHSSKTRLNVEHVHQLVPVLEINFYGNPPDSPTAGAPLSVGSNLPRIFSTHIPYQLLEKTLDPLKCRVVYVTRNPKDTLVSMWNFINKSKWIGKEPWPLEMAVENFCNGFFPNAPYYEHVMGYKRLSLERPENVLFLTYEDLKSDPKNHVRTLANFLGISFEGEEQVEEIVEGCSFEVLTKCDINMSQELLPSTPFPKNSFFRKGEVGDYKNFLTHDMIEKIDALTREKFHSSGFIYGI